VTLKPGLGSLNFIGTESTDTYRSATYDFLLTFHGIHGPISYRFWAKVQVQSKIKFCRHSLYFGFPLELGISTWGQKTKMMRLPGGERRVTIFSTRDCEASRLDSNSNRMSRFEFDSKVMCWFENLESAGTPSIIPQTTLTHCSTNWTKTSTFAPFVVEEDACLISVFINFVYFIKFSCHHSLAVLID